MPPPARALIAFLATGFCAFCSRLSLQVQISIATPIDGLSAVRLPATPASNRPYLLVLAISAGL